MKKEDPFSGSMKWVNKVPIASLMVVEPGEKTSGCIVLKSVMEITIGDAIEMLP